MPSSFGEPQEGDPTSNAQRHERPDSCLHCVLMTAIEEWFQRHGERRGNVVVIDCYHGISKLIECAVELAELAEDRSQRRRAIRFAHDAIDGAVKSLRTGKLVGVDMPPEH
jgi:hypothetical protein